MQSTSEKPEVSIFAGIPAPTTKTRSTSWHSLNRLAMRLMRVWPCSFREVKRAASCELPGVEKLPRSMAAIAVVVAVGIAFSIFADALTGIRLEISWLPRFVSSMTDAASGGPARTKLLFCCFFEISLKSIYRPTGASCQNRHRRVRRICRSPESCRLVLPVLKRSSCWCLTLPKLPVLWMLSSFP